MRGLKKSLLVAALALASLPAAAKDVTIGLSWNAIDNALPVKWEEYMRAEAKTQGAAAGLNIKWVVNVADADPTRQAANIEDLINQGVDLIMARAEDAAAIGSSIQAAKRAKIPFITFDRESSTTKPTAHVGGDSYDQGKTTAQAFLALVKQQSLKDVKCIELQGSLKDMNAVNRSKAWKEVTGKSAVKTVVQVPTEWNPELFRSGLVNALRAHPEANCLFVASDFALTAVQSALEGANKWAPRGQASHMWFASQDMFPEAVKAMEAKYIDVGTVYDAFAHSKEAIRVAVRILGGKSVDCPNATCLAKGRVATQENVSTLENLWSRQ